jgi:hypothetical protein
MGTFNIGSQNAASIVNVDGNMTVQGDIRASAAWEVHQLRTIVGRLQDEAAGLPLEPARRAEVDGLLAAASAEASEAKPDKRRLAELLGTATQTLKDAGALASAGTGLVEALRAAAAVLGPVGQALIAVV